jgi:hypothetical protein
MNIAFLNGDVISFNNLWQNLIKKLSLDEKYYQTT